MKIKIGAGNTFTVIGTEVPSIGTTYALEDVTEGSGEQNRLFHALVQEYWSSGLSSYPAKTFDRFREQVKQKLGAGFDRYFWAEIDDSGNPVAKTCDKQEEVPREIWDAPDRNKRVFGRLKSWTSYTKKERRSAIDRLIEKMIADGVASKKFDEILKGLEEAKMQSARGQ